MRLIVLVRRTHYYKITSVTVRDIMVLWFLCQLTIYRAALRQRELEMSLATKVFISHSHCCRLKYIHKLGGLGISFNFEETRLCFVGSHLAARDERINARNANYTAIVNGLRITKSPFDITNYHHAIFWLGDLNYRIALP